MRERCRIREGRMDAVLSHEGIFNENEWINKDALYHTIKSKPCRFWTNGILHNKNPSLPHL